MQRQTMNTSKIILITLFSLLFYLGCEKDEEVEPNVDGDSSIGRLDVTQYQVAQIVVEGELNADEFEGKLDTETISVYRSSDSTVAFYVPGLNEGTYLLSIPSLDYHANLSIAETELEESPKEILTGVEMALNSFSTNISADDEDKNELNASIQGLSEMLEKTSDEEKLRLAKFYKANESAFREILFEDYDNANGRTALCLTCASANFKFKVSVLAFGVGVGIAWFAPDPLEKLLGGAIARVGWKKAKKFGEEVTSGRLKVLYHVIDNISSSRVAGNSLEFYHGQEKVLDFKTSSRNISLSDQNSDEDGVALFFSSFDLFNLSIDKLNTVIEFVNDKLPFTNIDLLQNFATSSDLESANFDVAAEVFENYSFSTSNPDINVSAELTQDGKIGLTLTADESIDLTEPIESKLVITYSDEFNESTQGIDINLSFGILGTWQIQVSETCQTNDGETVITKNNDYTATITLNENGTISGDFGDVQILVNTYTFENWNLNAEITYNFNFGFTCNGKTTQRITETFSLVYDHDTDQFVGTSTLSRNLIAGETPGGGGCSAWGEQCSGTVVMYR